MSTPAPPDPDVGPGSRSDPEALHQQQRLAFRVHAAVFAAAMVLIFTVNLLVNLAAGTTGWSAWWSIWALIGWSAGLAVHGFVVWLARPGGPAIGGS